MRKKNRTIRVMVDTEATPKPKAARGTFRDLVKDMAARTVELEFDIAEQEIRYCYGKIRSLVAQLPHDEQGPQLESVAFTICLDSEGKASLLSAVSASSKARTGITFTLVCEKGTDLHE